MTSPAASTPSLFASAACWVGALDAELKGLDASDPRESDVDSVETRELLRAGLVDCPLSPGAESGLSMTGAGGASWRNGPKLCRCSSGGLDVFCGVAWLFSVLFDAAV